MYESEEAYQAVMKRERLVLENRCRCRIVDGYPGLCPSCGERGTWDIAGRGFGEGYGNSIYYSTIFHQWRCRFCEMRSIC